MNHQELTECKIQSAKGGRRSAGFVTKPSRFGELYHPEVLFLGIDGGVDSYIAR